MRGGVIAFLHRVLRFCKRHKGGVLIEFTFSIPVCIALLFFVSDHYRFYELKNKLKSSAYLAASLIQQLKNNSATKQLASDDMARIVYASCLNFFHTLTMFRPYPFGIYYLARFYYVKKISNGNYQYQHILITTGKGGNPHPVNAMSCSIGSVETKTPAQVEEIHQDLVCYNSGEERLFIKCWYNNPNANIYPYNKSKLGLFLLEPKFGEDGNFVYQLVITPKPGLFPVKNE